MDRLQIWVQAARPKTLILSVCPVIIGGVLALSAGYFEPLLLLLTLITALGIQIGTNFANDYFDFIRGADTWQRKGPVRVTQAGLVSLPAIKRATALVFLCTALSGAYLVWEGGLYIGLLLILSIILGVVYTGGPFPLAYLGVSEFFVLVFFGPVATAGTYYLQTHSLSPASILAGLAPGAISSAVLIINNLRDIEEDRLARKRTLIVRFGRLFGKCEYTAALLLAACAPLFFLEEHPYTLLASLIVLPSLPMIIAIFKNQDPYSLIPILQKTAQLLGIYTLVFCIAWML